MQLDPIVERLIAIEERLKSALLTLRSLTNTNIRLAAELQVFESLCIEKGLFTAEEFNDRMQQLIESEGLMDAFSETGEYTMPTPRRLTIVPRKPVAESEGDKQN